MNFWRGFHTFKIYREDQSEVRSEFLCLEAFLIIKCKQNLLQIIEGKSCRLQGSGFRRFSVYNIELKISYVKLYSLQNRNFHQLSILVRARTKGKLKHTLIYLSEVASTIVNAFSRESHFKGHFCDTNRNDTQK